MPRRAQGAVDRLGLVCLVCFIGGTAIAAAPGLTNHQFSIGVLVLAGVLGLVLLLLVRQRRGLNRAIPNFLMAGLLSLVVGFFLLRALVTYSMGQTTVSVADDPSQPPSETVVASMTITSTETAEATATATAEAAATETPEATATETAEATTTETPEVTVVASCGQATVSGVSALNVRSEPSAGSQVLGNRLEGTVVELLCDEPVEVNGQRWRHVRSENVEGWMSERYLSVSPAPSQ